MVDGDGERVDAVAEPCTVSGDAGAGAASARIARVASDGGERDNGNEGREVVQHDGVGVARAEDDAERDRTGDDDGAAGDVAQNHGFFVSGFSRGGALATRAAAGASALDMRRLGVLGRALGCRLRSVVSGPETPVGGCDDTVLS